MCAAPPNGATGTSPRLAHPARLPARPDRRDPADCPVVVALSQRVAVGDCRLGAAPPGAHRRVEPGGRPAGVGRRRPAGHAGGRHAVTAAMSRAQFDSVAERFKVLAEPARLRILDALRHGPRHVGALVEATGLQQANLSRHLQQLYLHGFVERSRTGTFVHYAIADPKVFALCDLMCGQTERSQRMRRAARPPRRPTLPRRADGRPPAREAASDTAPRKRAAPRARATHRRTVGLRLSLVGESHRAPLGYCTLAATSPLTSTRRTCGCSWRRGSRAA